MTPATAPDATPPSRPGPAGGVPLPPAPGPPPGVPEGPPLVLPSVPYFPPVPVRVPPSCEWYLAGTWVAEGEYTAGRLAGQTYRTTVEFRQFGSHLVGTQADDALTYYGRCTGDAVELEVWAGWDFSGRQVGRIAPDGQSIAATWVL